MSIALTLDAEERRNTFFRFFVPRDDTITSGYMRICRRGLETKVWEELWYSMPEQIDKLCHDIGAWMMSYDIYYSPMLFERTKATKEHVLWTPCAWADLDACPPEVLRITPSVLIESSPGRYQALWIFSEHMDPADAEDISKRIAYTHRAEGADISGWDLTQVLRVPFTFNFKYVTPNDPPPVVMVLDVNPGRYTDLDFAEHYPAVRGITGRTEFPIPEPDQLPEETADEVLARYKHRIQPAVWGLYSDEPSTDWSRKLWQLEMFLFEAGMTREEVFVVATTAACNKYARDGRDDKFLWNDVVKAWNRHQAQINVVSRDAELTELLSDADRRHMESETTIVDEYIEWAKGLGDAAWQYHQAGAFILLSSLLAGPVRLPTSFGTVVPNLWFMILADTTLTRKSTAMDIAMDLLAEIDSDAVLATDGSIEGLFASLSTRPGRPSVFLRDEFSGLVETMTKKDYQAGMAEAFTKLYDGKFQKKVLRREIIEVKEPVLILFAGGIKNRVLSLLTYEHIGSGFLPRFVFITAESDVSKLRPLGPPSDQQMGKRGYIQSRLAAIHAHYNSEQTIKVAGQTLTGKRKFTCELTDSAWKLYNHFENQMLRAGLTGTQKDLLTPIFDRLAKSGLKAALLLAAADELRDSDRVVVTERHIMKAFYYVEDWRTYALDVVNNIGRSANERLMGTILTAVQRNEGITRSELMQSYHLTAKDAELIFQTLEQRGRISRVRAGRTERIYGVKS